MEEESGGDEGGGGAPGWMATFADLMSLLLAFFVLLFSFASVDDQVYKEVGGSLSEAFGVQRRELLMDQVLGINHIAQEYSSGRTDPNILNVVPQEDLHVDKPNQVPQEMSENEIKKEQERGKKDFKGTTPSEEINDVAKSKSKVEIDESKNHMKLSGSKDKESDIGQTQSEATTVVAVEQKEAAKKKEEDAKDTAAMGKALSVSKGKASGAAEKNSKKKANNDIAKKKAKDIAKGGKQELLRKAATALEVQRVAEVRKKALETTATIKAKRLGDQMAQEIANGKLKIDTEGNRVIIRISEETSFAPGSVRPIGPFLEIIQKVGKAIEGKPGKVIVAGHTDNIPVQGEYNSNWELSSARAVSVIDGLIASSDIPKKNFLVEAYGDTKPIATNTTPEGRSKNRRVEVILEYDKMDLVPQELKPWVEKPPSSEEEEEVEVEEELDTEMQEALTAFESSLRELTGPDSTSEKYDMIFEDDFFQ